VLTFVLSVLHVYAITDLFELVPMQSVTLHSVNRLQHNLLKHCEVIKMPCHVLMFWHCSEMCAFC
jgi:hypothetical protein